MLFLSSIFYIEIEFLEKAIAITALHHARFLQLMGQLVRIFSLYESIFW